MHPPPPPLEPLDAPRLPAPWRRWEGGDASRKFSSGLQCFLGKLSERIRHVFLAFRICVYARARTHTHTHTHTHTCVDCRARTSWDCAMEVLEIERKRETQRQTLMWRGGARERERAAEQ